MTFLLVGRGKFTGSLYNLSRYMLPAYMKILRNIAMCWILGLCMLCLVANIMEWKEEKNIIFYKLLSILFLNSQIYFILGNPMEFYCLFKVDYNNLFPLPNLTTIDAGGMLCWIVLNACKSLCLGGQHSHGEIFSKKRQKLRKWVVETSYPHIEELCSKGLDTWPFNKFFHFILASCHGLVEIFSGMVLFLCFSVACSLRATKTAYVPFAFHMDVTYSVGVGD